jgi:hypothetical protein
MRIIILFFLAFFCSGTNAQYMLMDGDFNSKGLSVRVVLLDRTKGVAAVSASVEAGECSGNISGIGEIKNRKLIVRSVQEGS